MLWPHGSESLLVAAHVVSIGRANTPKRARKQSMTVIEIGLSELALLSLPCRWVPAAPEGAMMQAPPELCPVWG